MPVAARRRVRGLAAIGTAAAACAFATFAVSGSHSGEAAFPGSNGRIAYSYGNNYSYAGSGIWSTDPGGSSPQMLSNGNGDASPAYSPDGSRIAFEREGGIAAMNADGSGIATLLPGSASQSSQTEWREGYVDPYSKKTIPIVKVQSYSQEWRNFAQPSFSPDGSQLAVSESTGKRVNASICAVEAPGEQECIGYSKPGQYYNFEYGCTGCGSHLIAISSATGAQVGQLTALVSGRRDNQPAYAANGKLAFTRRISGRSSIYVIASPGAAPARVTTGNFDRAPDFSPDGSQIAFDHGGEGIALVGAGGGVVTLVPVPVSEEAASYTSSPAFSPDGSRIAFHRTVYGSQAKAESGLFTIGLDGSGLTRVAEGGFDPSWQPRPLPPAAKPARAKARKGKVRLDKKGRATVGKITCGSTRCSLKVLAAKLKTGKRSCSVKTHLAKKLAPGKSAPLGVKVAGKCLAALRKAGRGRLFAKVRVTDALGNHLLTLKATLVAPAAKKGKKAKHGRE
jgi:hypothetical protein